MQQAEQIRVFVALEIADSEELTELQDDVADDVMEVPDVNSYMSEETLHLPLAFLGSVDARAVPALGKAIEQAVYDVEDEHGVLAAHELYVLPELQVWGSNALALPVDHRPLLHALIDAIRAQVESVDAGRDALIEHNDRNREFMPHITIGRVSGEEVAENRQLTDFLRRIVQWQSAVTVQIASCTLYQTDGRGYYTPLVVFD
jgi:2'-5' RNA ligase